MRHLSKSHKIVLFSLFLTLAVVVSIAEFFLPRILPYMKPGFSNIIVLLALLNFGITVAIILSILKSLLASVILGYFLSATFYLSFFGSLFSAFVMGILYRAFFPKISIISISIAGALIHSLTQLILVFTFLVKNSIIFINLGPILILSIGTGIFNGWLCLLLQRRMEKGGILLQ